MKRNIFTTTIIVLIVCISLFAFAACDGGSHDDEERGEALGNRIGVYYYDDVDGDEYLITLSAENEFGLLIDNSYKSGKYLFKEGILTLNFSDEADGTLSANFETDALVLKYNNTEMRFLKKITYTVSFDSDGGSVIDDIKVVNGRAVTKPADPTRSGYVFIGWYMDSAHTEPFLFDSPIISDIVLYALWAQEGAIGHEFIITYDLNYVSSDEAPVSQQTVGGKLYGAPIPQRNDFTFRGWYVSMYGDAAKPSYFVNENTVFAENTTLYAYWESKNLGSKLPAPAITVSGNNISWASVGAITYRYEVSGPIGFTQIISTTSSNGFVVDFASSPAGDYTIKVTAAAASSSNNSDTTIYYKNKSLAKVSIFTVISPSILLFNSVDNAEEYLIDIECGNKSHNHNPFNNGASTNFNFANCAMREDGIKFIVTAIATGYLESVSEVFYYNRELSAVTNLRVDDATQAAYWTPVAEATNYIVTIECSGNHAHTTVDNGAKTSYDLRECGTGEIKIGIRPATKGYNSPKSTEITYNKTTLATPSNIRISGTELSWDEVNNATSYSINVGGKLIISTSNRYDLADVDIDWSTIVDCTVQVRANGESAANSLWSDALDVRYLSLFGTLYYARSTVEWRHVVGATKYQVAVNDEAIATITDGCNYQEVKLTKAGDNTISVRFFDDGAYQNGSAWVTISVYAYTIDFDSRSGDIVDSIYVAYGDKVNLPTTQLEGYRFGGWYMSPGGAKDNAAKYEDEYFAETGDIVLYAFWDEDVIDLVLVSEDNVYIEEVRYNKNYKLIVPESEDKKLGFLGWYSQLNGKGERYTDAEGKSYKPWENLDGATLYAYWAEAFSFTTAQDTTNTSQTVYVVREGADIAMFESVVIPTEYEGLYVRQIGSLGFSNAIDLRKLVIPDTISVIGTDAFLGCNSLESIEMYTSNLVAENAIMFRAEDGVLLKKDSSTNAWGLYFYPAAKFGDYTIPSYVSTIGIGVFKDIDITGITIPVSVTSIESKAFENCSQLREIIFESVDSVTAPTLSIADAAFMNCTALNSIMLPKRLNVFGAIPNGNNGVFNGCNSLTNILVAESNVAGYSSAEGVLVKNGEIVYFPEGRAEGAYTIPSGVIGIAAYAFYGNTQVTELNVSNWIISIGEYAFANSGIKKLTFAGNADANSKLVVSIGAFSDCANLTEVIFESGSRVTSLGMSAFAGDKGITAIELPSSLEFIGDEAFASTGLTSVTFESNTKDGARLEFGSAIFKDTSIMTLNLPVHVSSINLAAFNGIKLNEISIDANNKYYTSVDGVLYDSAIETLLFFPSTKGGDIELPSTLKNINDGAFKENSNLKSIIIGSNVTYIGAEAFRNCTGLTSVTFNPGDGYITFGTTIPTSGTSVGVEEEGGYTFADCTAITSLTLNRIKNIPAYFTSKNKGLHNVTQLVIPEGVETIGNRAFYYISYDSSDSSSAKQLSITLPSTLKSIGDFAFGYARGLKEIKLPENIESIGEKAFTGCNNLQTKTLDIPSKVTYMGSQAFASCNLTTITVYAKDRSGWATDWKTNCSAMVKYA